MTHEESPYDVAIIGTSLEHSVLAAALAIEGLKVVHLDQETYYGESSTAFDLPFEPLSFSRLIENVREVHGPAYTSIKQADKYNIELSPRILYAASETVQHLRDLNISDYVQFKAMEAFYIHDKGSLRSVPTSKEDIFTEKTLPLLEKNRLMKFVKFVLQQDQDQTYDELKDQPILEVMTTHFRIQMNNAMAIAYAVGFATDEGTTLSKCRPIISTHLRGIGLFGPFPAVVPMYGAGSELAQAFCRKAAVKGTTYILGQKFELKDDHRIELENGMRLEAKRIVSRSIPVGKHIRRILLVHGDFADILKGGDAASIVFPAGQGHHAVQCQVHGSGTAVCPAGQSIIYMTTLATPRISSHLDDLVTTLLQGRELMTSIEFAIKDEPRHYDDIIAAAQDSFMDICGENAIFLPREAVSDDQELDTF